MHAPPGLSAGISLPQVSQMFLGLIRPLLPSAYGWNKPMRCAISPSIWSGEATVLPISERMIWRRRSRIRLIAILVAAGVIPRCADLLPRLVIGLAVEEDVQGVEQVLLALFLVARAQRLVGARQERDRPAALVDLVGGIDVGGFGAVPRSAIIQSNETNS